MFHRYDLGLGQPMAPFLTLHWSSEPFDCTLRPNRAGGHLLIPRLRGSQEELLISLPGSKPILCYPYLQRFSA